MSVTAALSIDSSRKRRRGPLPLPVGELRVHGVSVRLNGAELLKLDAQRAPVHMQRGEYIRAAALHRLPPTIPTINQAAFIELSRAASNLNQLSHAMNQARHGYPVACPGPDEIGVALDDFRRALIGADLSLSDEQ
jgi:hypothetical protein